MDTLEQDLQGWIEAGEEELRAQPRTSQVLIQNSKNKIDLNDTELNLLFEDLVSENHASNDRTMKKFRVALTFAGENRGYVESVANALEAKLGKGSVFYDRFFQAELARMDLDIFLQDIYHDKSEFIVIFFRRSTRKKNGADLNGVR